MADVKWIKITTDIFDDEKILLVESIPESDSVIVIWFKLLCLAGKQNNKGVFMLNDKIAYTDEMLASIFRRPINTVRLALKTFQMYGMIEIVDNVITIPNWDKHQSLDALEKKKEYDRQYQAKKRQQQKLLIEQKNRTISNDENTSIGVLDIDKDIDKELDKDKDNNSKEKTKRFSKPTIEQIKEYCNTRNNNVDPNKFYDYYESVGWKVGKNSMKNWKAAVRTWEKNTFDKKIESKGIDNQSNNQFEDINKIIQKRSEEFVASYNYDEKLNF